MTWEPPPDFWEEDGEDDAVAESGWRRPILIIVAAVTALALAAVPLYNVIVSKAGEDAGGLEVCGFDYCIVQEAMVDADLDHVMALLANTYLDDSEAQTWADAIAASIDIEPVDVQVVDHIDGDPAGLFDPDSRVALVERPARAWIVLHEVVHAVARGHGADFIALIGSVARDVDEGSLALP